MHEQKRLRQDHRESLDAVQCIDIVLVKWVKGLHGDVFNQNFDNLGTFWPGYLAKSQLLTKVFFPRN